MELSRNLRTESIARLDPAAPWTISAGATVAEAVALLRQHRIGSLLVVDGELLVGIFTERDLLTRVLAAHRPMTTIVKSVMTPDPVTVLANESIRTAVKRMQNGGYRHLPVVDERQRPIGVVSAKRIIRYLVEHFPAIVYNQPPDPKQVPDSAEGA